MKKNPNIALFDMDGTLANFDGGMEVGMQKLASPKEIEDGNYFPREQDSEPYHIRERRRIVKRTPGFWRDLAPLETGMTLLNSAINIGYQISILTKAPRTNFPAWTEKVEWCWKNLDMDEDEIQMIMAENKSLVYGRLLVDDYPPYVIPWLSWRPRGLVIMPAQVWNEGFKHDQVIRVFDRASLEMAVEAMEVHYHKKIDAQRSYSQATTPTLESTGCTMTQPPCPSYASYTNGVKLACKHHCPFTSGWIMLPRRYEPPVVPPG